MPRKPGHRWNDVYIGPPRSKKEPVHAPVSWWLAYQHDRDGFNREVQKQVARMESSKFGKYQERLI